MKRSELVYVMSLGRGGVPDRAVIRDSRALRRALENREHSAACASASGGTCECSCGGALHGGGESGDTDLIRDTRVSAINRGGDGRTYVGFTDSSAEPPRNHYLPEGGEEDGWKVASADYDSEEAVLEKGGKRITVKLGGGRSEESPEAGDQRPEDGGGSGSQQGRPAEEQPESDAGGFDIGGAWEDFQESGIWSMGDANREGIVEDIRERFEQEGDDALENGERKFLEQYGKWESVQSMAGMIVEGGGGEPAPFAETRARLDLALDAPDATDEDRAGAMLVYRAEMEAARRIWETKAGQAYFTKHGRSPDTEEEAREGERLAGVPYEYEGSLADGYLENRRRCGRRRRRLANRVAGAARRRLANVGWTDEARAAALAARRANAAARAGAAPPDPSGGRGVAGGASGGFVPPWRRGRHYPPPGGYSANVLDPVLIPEGELENVGDTLALDGGFYVKTYHGAMRMGANGVLSRDGGGNILVKTKAGTMRLPAKSVGTYGFQTDRAGNPVIKRNGWVIDLNTGTISHDTDWIGPHRLPGRKGVGYQMPLPLGTLFR